MLYCTAIIIEGNLLTGNFLILFLSVSLFVQTLFAQDRSSNISERFIAASTQSFSSGDAQGGQTEIVSLQINSQQDVDTVLSAIQETTRPGTDPTIPLSVVVMDTEGKPVSTQTESIHPEDGAAALNKWGWPVHFKKWFLHIDPETGNKENMWKVVFTATRFALNSGAVWWRLAFVMYPETAAYSMANFQMIATGQVMGAVSAYLSWKMEAYGAWMEKAHLATRFAVFLQNKFREKSRFYHKPQSFPIRIIPVEETRFTKTARGVDKYGKWFLTEVPFLLLQVIMVNSAGFDDFYTFLMLSQLEAVIKTSAESTLGQGFADGAIFSRMSLDKLKFKKPSMIKARFLSTVVSIYSVAAAVSATQGSLSGSYALYGLGAMGIIYSYLIRREQLAFEQAHPEFVPAQLRGVLITNQQDLDAYNQAIQEFSDHKTEIAWPKDMTKAPEVLQKIAVAFTAGAENPGGICANLFAAH